MDRMIFVTCRMIPAAVQRIGHRFDQERSTDRGFADGRYACGEAGILSGDQILKINGTATDKMDSDARIFCAAARAKVTLTLLSPPPRKFANTRSSESRSVKA